MKLIIERISNGFIIEGESLIEGDEVIEKQVIEEDEIRDCKSVQKMLYAVMEYFGLEGSKHDPERVRVEIVRRKD